jgi:hypothetical protein
VIPPLGELPLPVLVALELVVARGYLAFSYARTGLEGKLGEGVWRPRWASSRSGRGWRVRDTVLRRGRPPDGAREHHDARGLRGSGGVVTILGSLVLGRLE